MSEQISVEIVKVYQYRQARVNTGIYVPREVFQFVQDTVEPSILRDNHQTIIARISGAVTETVALYFTDFTVVVGNVADIVEK